MRYRRLVSVVVVGLLGLALGALALAKDAHPPLTHRGFAASVSRGLDPPPPPPTPIPTPTPEPTPYDGPVSSLYLASAALSESWPVDVRDTTYVAGQEVLQDPDSPGTIAWYARFGHPGFRGHNSLFAAHVNYVGYGNGPFAHLMSAQIGDILYVTMADGEVYGYTVNSVELRSLYDLDTGGMQAVVYPALASDKERITLISCGGDFIPYAGGGGEYTSRVVLVAERYVP